MNFLIFDNEFSSLNLIDKLLSDFYYVKLVTSNESKLNTIPSSSFISITQGDMNNASEVIEHLSKHEDDPYDAVLIFNFLIWTGLNNVIRAMERLKRKPPHLFLFSIGQGDEIDQNLQKLLEESSEYIQWTIIFCNEIHSSTSRKYQVETKVNSTHQQNISAIDLVDFLCDELKRKTHLNKIIFLY